MTELMNYISYKDEFEHLLLGVTGCFIYDGGKTIAKSEVVTKAKQIAARLSKDEYISISLNNSPEWWMISLAGLLAGATIIVYPNEKNREDITNDSEQYGVKKFFFAEEDVNEFLLKTDNKYIEFPCTGRLVLFTSGTQFKPKGVIIEMGNYIPNLIATQHRLHMKRTDVNAALSPYSHAMGFMYGSCDFFYGGDFVICKNQLEFTNLTIGRKINIACMQPIYLESMIALERFTSAVASMRYVLIGGAPVSQSAYDFYCRIGAKILNGYGMTECVAGIAITDSEHNENTDRSLDIMDSAIINISKEGEILVAGATVCEQYINGNPILNKDGWYHTHDIGYVRDGRLYVTGRMDNVIVCDNGYKISLESVEDKILKINEIFACTVEYIEKCLMINIVSTLSVDDLKVLIDDKLEYYERPFKIKKVEKLEVRNGKKLRNNR